MKCIKSKVETLLPGSTPRAFVDNLFVSSIKQGNSENGGYSAQNNGENVA